MANKEKWIAPLSTTSHNNIGLIQVRQDNVNSETWNIPIVQNGEEFDMTLNNITEVMFCTKFDPLNPVEKKATIIDSKKGIISYTMDHLDMQKVGIQSAYFKFLDKDGSYQGSTQSFTYKIIKSIEQEYAEGKTYIVRLEELFEFYQKFQYQQQQDAIDYHVSQISIWEKFFNDYREIIESIDPGGLVLKELIEAKGEYTSLSERLDNIFDYNELYDNTLETIPSQTVQEFGTYINTIDNRKDTIRILHMNDIHYQKALKKEYSTATDRDMNRLKLTTLLNGKIDAAMFNGDLSHDNESINLTKLRLKQVSRDGRLGLSEVDCFFTIGNHDTHEVYGHGSNLASRYKANVISLKEVETILDAKNNNFGENRRTVNGTYAFKDYDDKKVRIIQLSGFENPEKYNTDTSLKYPRTYNSVFDANQINWLANSALKNVPEGYGVIAFNHSPIQGFFNNQPYANYTNVNHDIVKGVLRAFCKGTNFVNSGKNTDYPISINVDYSSQGPRKLIGIVSGHEHRDAIDFESDDDLKAILRTCSIASGTPNRVLGQTSEFAIDVIEINMTDLTVKFNRFGAGQSLEYKI